MVSAVVVQPCAVYGSPLVLSMCEQRITVPSRVIRHAHIFPVSSSASTSVRIGTGKRWQ